CCERPIAGPKSWDPGSTYIAYTVEEFPEPLKDSAYDRTIWMVSRDGLENVQLTEDYFDFEPRWSPDGTMILFADDANKNSRDGSGSLSGSVVSREEPAPTEDTYDLLVLYFDIDETFDDGDGVSSTEESGPAGDDPAYDGDENGTPDYLQNSAASLHAESGDYVTLGLDRTNNASFNEDVQAVPPPGTPPNGLTFPLGFFSYSIDIDDGACTTVTIYAPKDESINSFWKYDDTNGYYQFLYDGTTGAEIFHDADQTRIVLHLCDGQRGDADFTVNGTIVEPGATKPGILSPAFFVVENHIPVACSFAKPKILSFWFSGFPPNSCGNDWLVSRRPWAWSMAHCPPPSVFCPLSSVPSTFLVRYSLFDIF
ncbi:MAG: PD40 domain-containing protein, partial [Deltaproteobacteria bacterium]|nr:PD40 domain-containing protein [Deltaproteobacteria bacterium]